MAHYCQFCEKTFVTFAQIRTHRCSPDSAVAKTFRFYGASKPNGLIGDILVDDSEMTTTDMRNHFTQGMNMNGSRNSFEYLADFYRDPGNRNDLEMNNSEVKDLSKSSISDDNTDRSENSFHENGTSEKESERDEIDTEGSLSIDSDYVYTLDGTESVESDTSKSKDDTENQSDKTQGMDKDGDCEVVREEEADDSGYVYVLESDSTNQRQESQEQKVNSDEALCLSTKAADVEVSRHKQTEERLSLPKHLNGETEHNCIKTSSVLENGNQNAYTKDQIKDNEIVRLVGASKRKRKSSLESALLHIMRNKTRRVENESVETDSSNESIRDTKEGAISNEQDCLDLSVHNSTVEKEVQETQHDAQPVDLSKTQQVENRQSPDNLSVSKKANRRKSSVVARCVNTEAEEQTLVYQQKEVTVETNQPLDFSFTKTNEIKPETPKPEAPKTSSTPKTEKVHALDLSASSIKKPKGVRRARSGAPAHPRVPSQQDIMEMMKKMSSNFVNQNMMANFMQFQMWMQAAAMNNTAGNIKHGKNGFQNDLNKNVVMRDLLTGPVIPDMSKPNMNRLMAGQYQPMHSPFIPNGTAKPVFTADQAIAPKMNDVKPIITDDMDMLPSEGVTNWTSNASGGDLSKQPLTDFKEKAGGEPVRFFVKDNEQVQTIVNNLLQAGAMSLSEIVVGSEDLKYICRICDQKFFHVEHLVKHVKKRHIMKKYQCNMCDRSFHDAGNYRQHMRVHDANDVPYECPECQRRFRHKCTLKVHMRIHTGEKPFNCDICKASFKISSGLQTHMRKHTGETPYACEFCNLRFKCQSNLKQHLFQHTQARPFPCDICGKSYSRKSIRDTHIQTHLKGQTVPSLPTHHTGVDILPQC